MILEVLKKLALVTGAFLLIFGFLVILAALIFRYISFLTRPADAQEAYRQGVKLAGSKGKTYWVVVAHPDDAEWYAGGTLAYLARQNRVILVMCTSGEKGADEDNLGRKRENLQLQAAELIGYSQVKFLRIPDRQLQEHQQDLYDYLKRLAVIAPPAAIFTFDFKKPHYIYRHPDHLSAGEVGMKTGKELKVPLYLFHSSQPNVIFNYGEVKEAKRKALSVLSNYGNRSRRGALRFLRSLFFLLGRDRIEIYGFKASFPEVGVEYSETYRLVLPG